MTVQGLVLTFLGAIPWARQLTTKSVAPLDANAAHRRVGSAMWAGLVIALTIVGLDTRAEEPLSPVDALLDGPVTSRVINGELYLQRDLTEYLNATVGVTATEASDAPRALVRQYFLRPHPSIATLRRYFEQTGEEFAVPAPLLMAIGQVETNWTQVGPSIDQGWGVMHLVKNPYCDTLSQGAQLLGVDEETLKSNARQNIRAAAALIAEYAGAERDRFHEYVEWRTALARFSGLRTEELRLRQADTYLNTLAEGVQARTVWGERIIISKEYVGRRETLAAEADDAARTRPLSVDYAPALTMWAPPCNYASGRNHSVDTWVNHWFGTGTYLGTISWFQTCPGSGPGQRGYIPGTSTLYGASSAHFVIKNSTGEITQMVRVADTAYHAGASGYIYNNGRSIGVEHDATAANPNSWNSIAMLNASATMARYFEGQFGFPRAQNQSPGICGHNDMPGTSTTCPGPLPWTTWMTYFVGVSAPSNDNCNSATQLTAGTSCSHTAGTVANATASGAQKPTCDAFSSPSMLDVWYRFTAVNATHTITVDPVTSVGDPVVAIYSSCGGTLLACTDNGEGDTETATISGLSSGSNYYIRIYDYGSIAPVGTDANFEVCVTYQQAANYTLTVGGGGDGQGTVTGGGINCTINDGSTSGTCSKSFPAGTDVTLTASQNSGSSFSDWDGSCSGSGACDLTMNGNRNVTANFETACSTPSMPLLNAPSTAANGISYDVSWTATSEEGYYKWEEATDPSFSAISKTAGATGYIGTSRSVTRSPKHATTYYYRVHARNRCDGDDYWSPFSNVASTTVAGTVTVGKDDFNRDGKDDVIWRRGTTGANSLWFLNGSAVVGGGVAPPVSDTNWKLAGTGDFNADTHTDMLWHHDVTAANAVWFMNGPNYSSQTTLGSAAVQWKPSGVGDFNGNGTNDVVWRNSNTGENSIWFLNGTTVVGGGAITSVPDLTWRLVGAGDINGDGRADLIWWNSSSGALSGWLMNGLSSTSVFIGSVADTFWKASAVADTNGDGRADVIWRNVTNGGASVWFLNGSTVTGGGFIGAVADLQYDVVGAK